jgi:hypothetical protein
MMGQRELPPIRSPAVLCVSTPSHAQPRDPLWYICAMEFRRLAVCSLLLIMTLAYVPASGQATSPSAESRPAPRTTRSNAATQNSASQTAKPDCDGGPCDEQQPRVIVTLPAPAPPVWPWHDQVLWAAYLILAIVGYVGIAMAVSSLRKIGRLTKSAESSASAALLIGQSIIDSQRPWLLITVEPSVNIENSFNIMATNRGRTPGKITATSEQFKIAVDETQLPSDPQYLNLKKASPLVPIILLPGESTPIMPFRRDELRGVCENDEVFRRIERWEEKVFIYGKVVYIDLVAPPETQIHETNWCCWYIHGRQKSGLVIAGPPAYNNHT